MSGQWRQFSHVANFTGYMEVVAGRFAAQPKGLRILDLPAGNGLLAETLRGMGHTVVCSDINRERPDYQYVDMAAPLPFAWSASWLLLVRGGDSRFAGRNRELFEHAFRAPLLFSRSLVLVLERGSRADRT